MMAQKAIFFSITECTYFNTSITICIAEEFV